MKVSVTEMERLTGFTHKTIKKRLGELQPVAWETSAILYDSQKALPLLYQDDNRSDVQSLSYERALLAKSQRERNDLIIAQMRKDLAPSDEILRVVESMFLAVKAKLMSLPPKLVNVLSSLPAEDMHNLLDENIRELLTELSITDIEKLIEEREVIADSLSD